MDSRHNDALRRIYEADLTLARDGREPEQFHLRHSGGMESDIEHPRWDPSWATPSEHTIDDLEEMGYLRVEPHHNKARSFGLTLEGRKRGEELAAGIQRSEIGPQDRQPGGSYTQEERLQYAEQFDAEFNLAISAFLGRIGDGNFTEDDLVDAVQISKFDITAAVQWLRKARAEGIVAPAGGGWRVIAHDNGPTYHVRVVPTKARDMMSGAIYALDLTEDEVLARFVAPYQESKPISWGDRNVGAYRKPKIGRLYKPGADTVAEIKENLRKSRRVHAMHEAEDLFFEKTVQDVTDHYIDPAEPSQVDARDASPPRTKAATSQQTIFVVHGHSRKDEVARVLEQMTSQRVVVLGEQAGRSQTIIEKFEELGSQADFAVVLLTADDVGAAKDHADELRPRARQNVMLELGYFIGRIGREKVAVLYESDVELPSDYTGVEYIPFRGEWKLRLMRELREAGFEVVPPDA